MGPVTECFRWKPGLLAMAIASALAVALTANSAFAQETATEEAKTEEAATDAASTDAPAADTTSEAPAALTLDDVNTKAKDAALAGHNGWMLTCSALVLFMTAPGLAMFYGGLVRKKNVLGVMMQCLFLMGLMTVIWGLYGYSLAFGGVPGETGYNPYIGNTDFILMQNVQRSFDDGAKTVVTPMEGTLIPRFTHMLFQGMFFIITPALICGAFAERMKFSAMVLFMILWGTIVYCPLCHWVWDGGILAYHSAAGLAGGALDFAGGTVVHISSGVSALICALFLGKRLGYGSEAMPPHNLTYTVLGAAMLWVGWFGFNAGSELASDGLASSAFAATHFAAAAPAGAGSARADPRHGRRSPGTAAASSRSTSCGCRPPAGRAGRAAPHRPASSGSPCPGRRRATPRSSAGPKRSGRCASSTGPVHGCGAR